MLAIAAFLPLFYLHPKRKALRLVLTRKSSVAGRSEPDSGNAGGPLWLPHPLNTLSPASASDATLFPARQQRGCGRGNLDLNGVYGYVTPKLAQWPAVLY
jgi:hypothetical protein